MAEKDNNDTHIESKSLKKKFTLGLNTSNINTSATTNFNTGLDIENKTYSITNRIVYINSNTANNHTSNFTYKSDYRYKINQSQYGMFYTRYLNNKNDRYINIADFVTSVGYGINYHYLSYDLSIGYRNNNSAYIIVGAKEQWQELLIRPSLAFSLHPDSGTLKDYSFRIQVADVITHSDELKQFNAEVGKKIDQYISLSLSYNLELDHYHYSPSLNQTRQLTTVNVGISW